MVLEQAFGVLFDTQDSLVADSDSSETEERWNEARHQFNLGAKDGLIRAALLLLPVGALAAFLVGLYAVGKKRS